MGDGRWEMGDGRWEMGDGRRREPEVTGHRLKDSYGISDRRPGVRTGLVTCLADRSVHSPVKGRLGGQECPLSGEGRTWRTGVSTLRWE